MRSWIFQQGRPLMSLGVMAFLFWLMSFGQGVAATASGISVHGKTLAQLAVQDQGRKKPMTTLTRETLLALSGSALFYPQGRPSFWERIKGGAALENRPLSANEVMLDLWFQPEAWRDKALILVSHHPLKEHLGLKKETKLFSYNELSQNAALLELVRETRAWKRRNAQVELNEVQKEAEVVARRMDLVSQWLAGQGVKLVPHPSFPSGKWENLEEVERLYPASASLGLIQQNFQEMREAFLARNSQKFQIHLKELTQELRALSPEVYPSKSLLALEHFYGKFHPFRWAAMAFGLAFIILVSTFEWQKEGGYRLGWTFVCLGVLLQLAGFTMRMVISGRPPVTNMYETVIWLSFGTVFFGVLLEAIYRCRYFLVAAAPVAMISLVIADIQPTVLDSSIHPLVPVLRDHMWLIIHVLTITLGYAAFALALGLGHIVLGLEIFMKKPKDLSLVIQSTYRALQIGVLLLAIGTILGGVWANYSWGRFWDWDPKETWALIALLCYLAVLHGRLAGWWGGFGLAVGAILCFQAVLMAWYGVNFILGKGLHSYGFGTGGGGFVAAFVIVELVFVAIGLGAHYRRLARQQKEPPKNRSQEKVGGS